jgi:RNA-binding protein Nova
LLSVEIAVHSHCSKKRKRMSDDAEHAVVTAETDASQTAAEKSETADSKESPEKKPEEHESKKRPAQDEEDPGAGAKRAHTDGITAAPSETLALRMLVPSSKCGALIGKGGSGITKMQEDTGARLQLSRQDECFPGTTDRVMEAKGSLQALLTLQSIVLAQLQMEDGGVVNSGPMATKLVVSDSGAGVIIGKAGSQITAIQASSQATIQISKKGEHGFNGERLVTVQGSLETTLKASAEILNLLQLNGECEGARSSPRRASGGMGRSGGFGSAPMNAQMMGGGMGGGGGAVGSTTTTQAADGTMTAVVTISDFQAGNVIGRGGSTITQLQAMSGANIQISKKGESMDGTRAVTISGPPQGVEYAQMMVMAKVQSSIPADQAGMRMNQGMNQGMSVPQGGHGGGHVGHGMGAAAAMGGMGMGMGMGMGGGMASSAPGGQTQIQLPVDDSAAGHIIGKGGSSINEMQQVRTVAPYAPYAAPYAATYAACHMLSLIFACAFHSSLPAPTANTDEWRQHPALEERRTGRRGAHCDHQRCPAICRVCTVPRDGQVPTSSAAADDEGGRGRGTWRPELINAPPGLIMVCGLQRE